MNIFMFHFGRCGSTALASVISKIPGFFWHEEIFSHNTYIYDGFENSDLALKKGRNGDGVFDLHEFVEFIRIIKDRIQKQYSYSIIHYGCEIKSYHFEYNYFKFSLENALEALNNEFDNAKFIFLRRRNSLRRILSAIIARESGIYHINSTVENPTKIAIQLDNFKDADLNCCGDICTVLMNSIELEKRYSDLIKAIGGFEIIYEDHIDKSIEPAIDLIDYKLGTGRVAAETHLKKTNPFPISEMLINYDDVKLRLLDSGLESMLT